MALRAEDIGLPVGLVLDEVCIDAIGASIANDPLALKLEQPAKAHVMVSTDSISRFLNSKKPGGLSEFEVGTEDGLLCVSATARILVPIRAVAHCSLSIRDGIFLDVVLERIDPGAAKGIVEKKLASMNPILDASTLPFGLTMESTEIDGGAVIVRGTART